MQRNRPKESLRTSAELTPQLLLVQALAAHGGEASERAHFNRRCDERDDCKSEQETAQPAR